MDNENVVHLHDEIIFGCYENEIIVASMHTWPAPSYSRTPPHPHSTAVAPGHVLPFIVSDISSLVEFARHPVSLGLNLITEAQ